MRLMPKAAIPNVTATLAGLAVARNLTKYSPGTAGWRFEARRPWNADLDCTAGAADVSVGPGCPETLDVGLFLTEQAPRATPKPAQHRRTAKARANNLTELKEYPRVKPHRFRSKSLTESPLLPSEGASRRNLGLSAREIDFSYLRILLGQDNDRLTTTRSHDHSCSATWVGNLASGSVGPIRGDKPRVTH